MLVIKHRQNQNKQHSQSVSVDLRATIGEEEYPAIPVVNYDMYSFSNVLFVNNYTKCDIVLFNILCDQAENLILENVKTTDVNYYFLGGRTENIINSLTPDRYIPTLSDIETVPEKYFLAFKPKYIMIDWSGFIEFNKEDYIKFLKGIKKIVKKWGCEPIIMTPCVYGVDIDIKDILDKELKEYHIYAGETKKWETDEK
jgi:hypothetical protein